jgi:hypothetical protein
MASPNLFKTSTSPPNSPNIRGNYEPFTPPPLTTMGPPPIAPMGHSPNIRANPFRARHLALTKAIMGGKEGNLEGFELPEPT